MGKGNTQEFIWPKINTPKMMNNSLLVPWQFWKKQRFWYFAIAATFTVIYFSLVWQADDTGQLSMSLLFYFCVASLLKDKWGTLSFQKNWSAVCTSLLLMIWILLNISTTTDDYTVRLFPLISGLAIALLASGWFGLKQYWRELTIFFFLGVPSFLAYHFIDISWLTAKFSTLLLWYSGFDILSQGTFMALRDGRAVEVVYDCSGIDMVNYLLGMSIICLIMFPISGLFKQLFIPLAGSVIGFVVNGIRVAIMVVLMKFDQAAFNNWHTGAGSYTFALLGVVLLGLLYWLFINQKSNQQSTI